MEHEFRKLVNGNEIFKDFTLGGLAALPEDDLKILFNTTTVCGLAFKQKVFVLRDRYKKAQSAFIIFLYTH